MTEGKNIDGLRAVYVTETKFSRQVIHRPVSSDLSDCQTVRQRFFEKDRKQFWICLAAVGLGNRKGEKQTKNSKLLIPFLTVRLLFRFALFFRPI